MKDLHNNVMVSPALDPATIDSDTTTEGEVIDTQGFECLEFVVQTGELTDGAYAVALAHSDTLDGDALDDESAVSAGDLLGDLPSFTDSEGSTTKKVGYLGSKRYVRLDVVTTSTSDGGVIGAVAVQSGARNNPVS